MPWGTYNRLGLHVTASDRDVIRAARGKLHVDRRSGRRHRVARHAFYRDMIYHHRKAQHLYARHATTGQ